MDSVDSAVNAIEGRLASSGTRHKGVTAEEIQDFEVKHGVALGPVLRAWYLRFGGNTFNVPGSIYLTMWRLADVRRAQETLEKNFPTWSYKASDFTAPLFYFADHSIWVHAYLVDLTSGDPDPAVYVEISGSTSMVVRHFSDWVVLAAEDPAKIEFP